MGLSTDLLPDFLFLTPVIVNSYCRLPRQWLLRARTRSLTINVGTQRLEMRWIFELEHRPPSSVLHFPVMLVFTGPGLYDPGRVRGPDWTLCERIHAWLLFEYKFRSHR